MKYYLIVGEASGDLHASRLMRSLKNIDEFAEFRFFGGDLMAAEGGTRVKHYKELAYMGFVPVLMHLGTIFSNMKRCKEDIVKWKPDVVILVDYPGFNLNIAKFLKRRLIFRRTIISRLKSGRGRNGESEVSSVISPNFSPSCLSRCLSSRKSTVILSIM